MKSRRLIAALLCLPSVTIAILDLLADRLGVGGNPGPGNVQWLILVVCCFVCGWGILTLFARREALKKLSLYTSSILLLCSASYVVLEASLTVYDRFTGGWQPGTYSFFDESAKTIFFDPIRGYKLATIPSRFARITNGTIEYVGRFKGNSEGFPDTDDFLGKRNSPSTRRFAVFGDSFTAGQFLERNWPDRVEDRVSPDRRTLQLLNFSVYGGGLANWWSIAARFLIPKRYEIDGVIFAVFYSDLNRKFIMCDHSLEKRVMMGFSDSWDPDQNPKNLAEAKKYLRPVENSKIVSDSEFEELIHGDFRSITHFHLGLLSRVSELFINVPAELFPKSVALTEPQKALVSDLKKFFDGVPMWVIYMGPREELLARNAFEGSSFLSQAREFSSLLGAQFIDGRMPFVTLNQSQIQALHFPYDHHWNQKGSDQFAEFVLGSIPAITAGRSTTSDL